MIKYNPVSGFGQVAFRSMSQRVCTHTRKINYFSNDLRVK